MTLPNEWLRDALDLPEGNTPFPWQEALLTQFLAGSIERSLDIPTGLGKTAVMPIWLVARACGAKLPADSSMSWTGAPVVGQATEVAIGLRAFVDRTLELSHTFGLGERSLPTGSWMTRRRGHFARWTTAVSGFRRYLPILSMPSRRLRR
jgi:hypothetical protein